MFWAGICDGKRGENGKTGIWVKKRENGTGYGAIFPFSRPLPVFLQTSAWGSLAVLAPKPHQEEIEKIEDFIWRVCCLYRKVNSVTLPFEYPIP
jgi:hypothetical protein